MTRSSRRDFLRGKAANEPDSPPTESVPQSAEPKDTAPKSDASDVSTNSSPAASESDGATSDAFATDTKTRSYVVEVSRRAMACQFEVFLNAQKESAKATQHALEALDLVESLEDQLSVYRHRSEVSQLNVVARRRPVKLELGLFRLLQQAIELYEATDCAFDITAGPLIRLWAECRRNHQWPQEDVVLQCLEHVGSNYVRLDDENQEIQFLREGITIDLGGIGKGFALDRCADHLVGQDVGCFMMHGGTSSIVARGHRDDARPDRQGWTVGIRHPLREDRRLIELQLLDAAVGTSGAGTKQFYHQGKRYGHVLDPRTGYPAEGVLSTTVVAPTGAEADALSTAFYVLGPDRTQAYCERHPGVKALMTTASTRLGGVEIHAINCDDLDWHQVSET